MLEPWLRCDNTAEMCGSLDPSAGAALTVIAGCDPRVNILPVSRPMNNMRLRLANWKLPEQVVVSRYVSEMDRNMERSSAYRRLDGLRCRISLAAYPPPAPCVYRPDETRAAGKGVCFKTGIQDCDLARPQQLVRSDNLGLRNDAPDEARHRWRPPCSLHQESSSRYSHAILLGRHASRGVDVADGFRVWARLGWQTDISISV
jgi:hypothetical protein